MDTQAFLPGIVKVKVSVGNSGCWMAIDSSFLIAYYGASIVEQYSSGAMDKRRASGSLDTCVIDR
jgi:hypothetical protein